MRTVQSVKNSLKFKAIEKEGLLSVRVGVKKFTLPVSARIISGDSYLFLSFAASSELYRVEQTNLLPMSRDEEATDAFADLNSGKRRSRRRRSGSELAPELAEALRSIPEGYRLGYNADGSPRLIRKRTRAPKA
jgi:hypothetical protein